MFFATAFLAFTNELGTDQDRTAPTAWFFTLIQLMGEGGNYKNRSHIVRDSNPGHLPPQSSV